MANVKELVERRSELAGRIVAMRSTLGQGRVDFNSEERENWDRLNADFGELTRQIDRARDLDAPSSHTPPPGLEDRAATRTPGQTSHDRSEHRRALATQAWFRNQVGLDLSDEHREACRTVGFNPSTPDLTINLPKRSLRPNVENRANLTIGNASTGGNLVPTGFVYQLEKSMLDNSGCRQVCDVIRTDEGNDLPWPTANDTGNTGELVTEEGDFGSSVAPAFNRVVFGAFKFSSKPAIISNELLEDSAFELAREVPIMLGDRISRCQEGYFATGTGTGQPQGIVTGAALGKTSISATKFLPSEIIDLIHSVDPAYRSDPSFRLMAHDLVWAYVRKLVDGNGRFLYESAKDGGPDKVHGVPIVSHMSMANAVTTGAKVMVAGPMRKFKIRDVRQIRVRKLVDRYADKDQVGFVAFLRSDSRVIDAGTHPIRYLQMA